MRQNFKCYQLPFTGNPQIFMGFLENAQKLKPMGKGGFCSWASRKKRWAAARNKHITIETGRALGREHTSAT